MSCVPSPVAREAQTDEARLNRASVRACRGTAATATVEEGIPVWEDRAQLERFERDEELAWMQ